MHKFYRPTTVKDSEENSRTGGIGKNAQMSAGQAIAAALRALQADLGGKELAGHFDGAEGKEVAQSTVSRWIHRPDRFPAVFIPILCELSPSFQREHVRRIAAIGLLNFVEDLPAEHQDAVREALRKRVESMTFEQVAPGRWGR